MQNILETKSTAIKSIYFKPSELSMDIQFTSGDIKNFATNSVENFQLVEEKFRTTDSVGKTFHLLRNAGLLSVNGNVC